MSTAIHERSRRSASPARWSAGTGPEAASSRRSRGRRPHRRARIRCSARHIARSRDRVEYAIGRRGDARFALDVMVCAGRRADEDDSGAVVTLANLNYDTKRVI